MKHERSVTMAVSFLLSFITAFGAAGCLVSAFSLPLAGSLAAMTLTAALLSSLLLVLRHGGTILLCLTALGCGYLYHDGRAGQQLAQLIYHLTSIYDRAYGWGWLVLSEQAMDLTVFDWPVGILSALTALTVSRCICCRTSVWLPVLVSLIPVVPCIVVTDTVPGKLFLLLWLTGLILLVLTTSVRRENAAQGLQLTMAAALPVALGLCLLLLAVPQKDYVNQAADIQSRIRAAVERIPQAMDTGMNSLASRFQKDPPSRVDLAGLGPRLPFTYTVMEVTAQSGDTLYLRGRDYDSYDGLGWTATRKRQEVFSRTDGPSEAVTIRTENRKDLLYLPYYPQAETMLSAGRVENKNGIREYICTRNRLPENWRSLVYQNPAGDSGKWPQYCSIPEDTLREARELLSGRFGSDAGNTEKADIIAALVTDAAEYDLDPQKMPAGETDFALWFLQEGDSGYCVHFATAATVLLRAADVPARYVTGYMVKTIPGQTVTVTEEHAHAWAEYYEPALNVWIPLEVTPGTDVPVRLPETEPTAPETVPPETEAVKEETLMEETEPPSPETAPPVTLPADPEQPAVPQEAAGMIQGIRKLLKTLLTVLLILLLLSLIPLQRILRLRLRYRSQHTGTPNRQALRRWQEAERLCRLLKLEPPELLLNLAQKAKFSQYEIIPEELQQFDTFCHSCRKQLRERPWYLRWIYQYIFAAY